METIKINYGWFIAVFLVTFFNCYNVAYCSTNNDSQLIKTILNDYKSNIDLLKRVEFRYEEINLKRQNEPNNSAVPRIFKYDGKSIYLQQNNFEGQCEFERLIVEHDYYITVTNEVDKSRLTVLSVRDFHSLGDEAVLKNNIGGNLRVILWGEIRFTKSNGFFDFCSLDAGS
ncbi:MAG: hypothetical protein LBE18_06610 [Planctomycetaceae bacterium]|jgi:hypothetical protein|nr:hypothetical protein [Planctomycetaceae bacterium]